ncbi:hypothetical protein Pfo_013002 [Paulownia fortunei]|nr:hypothetical protein Pfo_013002 [Paulownia fortunei]
MDGAAKILNVLLSRASRLFRDFIIDQTNVFKSARKRDLNPFANFVKIAVVLFTRAEELQFRADKRFKEMGKEAPAEAANEMLASYTLPMSKDVPRADDKSGSEISLDEMKRDMSWKPCVIPYSRERGPCGNYFARPSSYDSWHEIYYIGIECGPPKGVGKVYQSYGVDDAYNRTGADGRHLLRGLQLILAGATLLDPYNRASSLSYNTCNMYFTLYLLAGSYGTQIPTSPYGSFPKDVQQAGVYPHLL